MLEGVLCGVFLCVTSADVGSSCLFRLSLAGMAGFAGVDVARNRTSALKNVQGLMMRISERHYPNQRV